MLYGATGCWALGSCGDDIILEGVGRSPNRGVRVRVSHCAGWRASQRLPRPHGNFLRGYLASTTSLRLTSLGKLLKQWDRARQLCIQCFEAIDTLFVALTIRSSILALVVQQWHNSLNSAAGGNGMWGAWGGMIARLTYCHSAHLYAIVLIWRK